MANLKTSRDAALPFVTFYDDSAGERTELSATSFRNWQAKTANYLRDGLNIEEGEVIELDLPPHWVVSVWVAAARCIGATLRLRTAGQGDAADVVVVGPDRLGSPPPGHYVVACSLHPMALPFGQSPGVGIEDYFGEVRSYGDFFNELDRSSPAISTLTTEYVTKWNLALGARILLVSKGVLSADALAVLYDVPKAIDGSVVIALNATPERIAAIADQERVTTTINV